MAELKRNLGPVLMLLYGLGTILGAGIYVLTGVVAGEAGTLAPLSFLLAALVAAPTAWSYSQLCARYPRAAGPAVYVGEAFGQHWLAVLIGTAVVAVGIVSAATIARGFVGYLQVLISLPDDLIVVLLITILTTLAAYGALASVSFAALIAIIETAGLLVVIGGGFYFMQTNDIAAVTGPVFWPETGAGLWPGVLAGAFLAFYAFIGFEDIVNMAEETRDPHRTLPFAIIGSLALATVLYWLVTWIAVVTVPVSQLANASAPMAVVIEHHGILDPGIIAVISMLAVVNGALVQIVMASRVIYGVSRLRGTENWLGHVHPRTRTPLNATVVTGAVILALALTLDLRMLAGITSAVTLMIFVAVNLALCVVQGQQFSLRWMIPWIAAGLSLTLLFTSFFLA